MTELLFSDDKFLTTHEAKALAKQFQEQPYLVHGYEDEELGLFPYISFYLFHGTDEFIELSNKVLNIFEKYDALNKDIDFRLIAIPNKDDSQTWVKPNSKKLKEFDWQARIQYFYEDYESFIFDATMAEEPEISSPWAFSADISMACEASYSTVKMNFDSEWYKTNKAAWYGFVQYCLQELQPEHAYSGYDVGTTTRVDAGVDGYAMQRTFTEYFYGLDVDNHLGIINHFRNDNDDFTPPRCLAAGLRTPVWSFLLSPLWIDNLGKSIDQIKAELDDPRIIITQVDNPKDKDKPSLWIQLGELSLYPVEEGVPDLLVKANQLIKPIRADGLSLIAIEPWNEANEYFDELSSPQWLARFDEDSEWPEGKRPKTITEPAKETKRLRCEGGEPCPLAGDWWSPAFNFEKRSFDKGDTMPVADNKSWATFWYMDK